LNKKKRFCDNHKPEKDRDEMKGNFIFRKAISGLEREERAIELKQVREWKEARGERMRN